MNQILSVEMPKKRTKSKSSGQNNKASTKSVIIVFCIVLIVLGIALIGIALFSMLGNKEQPSIGIQSDLPRIDVTQNATELEIEISCVSEISSIEYNWEDKEPEKISGNGKNYKYLKVDIPGGTNIFTLKVTDSEGRTNEYNKEYVGAKEPNITIFDPSQKTNTIIVKCEETQIIKYMSYYYDEEQEQKTDINNTVGTINIGVRTGEHNLTIKVGYEDGTVGKLSKKVYIPTIDVLTNGVGTNYTKFIIKASDTRMIEKVQIKFNGVETEEMVNQETYTKELDLRPGEPGSNELIIKVYNKDGMSITKGVKDSKRTN